MLPHECMFLGAGKKHQQERKSLGIHMTETHEFLTKALQMTADMIPNLVAVQKIRRERLLKRMADPKPIIEGEGDEFSFTEQGIG